MTLYGYARVSVREPEDKNLDLQVERLVRAGCAMGNIRAEEASGAKDDRGGLGLLDRWARRHLWHPLDRLREAASVQVIEPEPRGGVPVLAEALTLGPMKAPLQMCWP